MGSDLPRSETDHVRGHYDFRAPRYDRRIRLPERLLFADGRARGLVSRRQETSWSSRSAPAAASTPTLDD